MIFPFLKSGFIYLIILSLFSCANSTKNIIIAPEMSGKLVSIYPQISASLNILDLRTNRHIIQILRANKAAELINSTMPIAHTLQKNFAEAFTQQGLNLNEQSKPKIDIFIEQTLITVKQTLMKYKAKNEIVLRLQISDHEKTLTKSYRVHGKSEGPLLADLAVLERDFNQQLAKLIQQIVLDKEVQTFLGAQ